MVPEPPGGQEGESLMRYGVWIQMGLGLWTAFFLAPWLPGTFRRALPLCAGGHTCGCFPAAPLAPVPVFSAATVLIAVDLKFVLTSWTDGCAVSFFFRIVLSIPLLSPINFKVNFPISRSSYNSAGEGGVHTGDGFGGTGVLVRWSPNPLACLVWLLSLFEALSIQLSHAVGKIYVCFMFSLVF